MNKNIVIVLVGGFLVAVLVAVLVNMSLGSDDPAPADVQKIEIAVATKDLNIGHELKPGDMVWSPWPEDAMFSGAVRKGDPSERPEDLLKGRLSQAVAEGQPILKSFLIGETKGNFLAASLPPGMRAMGVSVKAETMAGGFIGPGDFVDVILTHKPRIRDRNNDAVAMIVSEYATETIVENVRVLAVDQTSKRDEDKAKVARTVTIAVDAKGAEMLALAKEMGDITLVLRSLGDEKTVLDGDHTTDVKVSPILRNIVKMESSSSGASGIVRIYNGEEINNMTVRQSVEVE